MVVRDPLGPPSSPHATFFVAGVTSYLVVWGLIAFAMFTYVLPCDCTKQSSTRGQLLWSGSGMLPITDALLQTIPTFLPFAVAVFGVISLSIAGLIAWFIFGHTWPPFPCIERSKTPVAKSTTSDRPPVLGMLTTNVAENTDGQLKIGTSGFSRVITHGSSVTITPGPPPQTLPALPRTTNLAGWPNSRVSRGATARTLTMEIAACPKRQVSWGQTDMVVTNGPGTITLALDWERCQATRHPDSSATATL